MRFKNVYCIYWCVNLIIIYFSILVPLFYSLSLTVYDEIKVYKIWKKIPFELNFFNNPEANDEK